MENGTPNEGIPWSEEQAKGIGKNISKFRENLRMSAETLSGLTADMGHRVPRSSIQKMEGGGKKTIVLHEALLLADVLGVPLGYLIYSPYDPGKMVRPYPATQEAPAFWAADKISPTVLLPSQLNNDNSRAVKAVRDLAHYRSSIHMVAAELGRLDAAIPQASLHQDDKAQTELSKWKSLLEGNQLDLLKARESATLDQCEKLGVTPWSTKAHKIPMSYYQGSDPMTYNPFALGKYDA